MKRFGYINKGNTAFSAYMNIQKLILIGVRVPVHRYEIHALAY